jgi:aerobic-type carbon monoxide dehydrogenase small subunit (CoxS/CutS family)
MNARARKESVFRLHFEIGFNMTMRIVGKNERVALDLKVNGIIERVHVEPMRFLSEVLRDDLGLTGVKTACGMANCGACTVLVDGVPTYSCITLALDCEGCAITTIEGLAQGDELNPVQRAFIEHDALQCGFCTPGQILSMTALLEKNPAPTENEIRHALSGNLCRCGAYVKILQAGAALSRSNQES